MLIAKKADVDLVEEMNGYSPLYLAATLNQVRPSDDHNK